MYKDFRMSLEKVFDVLGEIIAFFALVLFVFITINNNFRWVQNVDVLKFLNICNYWAGFLLIAIVGFEAAIKRNIVIRIIFYLLLAVAIIFMFFPNTYNALIDQANALVNQAAQALGN